MNKKCSTCGGVGKVMQTPMWLDGGVIKINDQAAIDKYQGSFDLQKTICPRCAGTGKDPGKNGGTKKKI